jgi:hypothetical protein
LFQKSIKKLHNVIIAGLAASGQVISGFSNSGYHSLAEKYFVKFIDQDAAFRLKQQCCCLLERLIYSFPETTVLLTLKQILTIGIIGC